MGLPRSLRLDQPDTARALLPPGDSHQSRLFAKVSSGAMPPGRRLPDAEIATQRKWIEEGAAIVLAATKPEAPPGVQFRRRRHQRRTDDRHQGRNFRLTDVAGRVIAKAV